MALLRRGCRRAPARQHPPARSRSHVPVPRCSADGALSRYGVGGAIDRAWWRRGSPALHPDGCRPQLPTAGGGGWPLAQLPTPPHVTASRCTKRRQAVPAVGKARVGGVGGRPWAPMGGHPPPRRARCRRGLATLQSFHKKPSTLAGSIVPSTSHMCLFCDATLSILVRRSRKSLKRDQSTIPGDAQRSRGTLS